MIDWTKPIETVRGGQARYLGSMDNRVYPHVIVFRDLNGCEQVNTCTDNGLVHINESRPFIRNVRQKHETWIALIKHEDHSPYFVVNKYEPVDAMFNAKVLAKRRIEIEEGEGLANE
jgi:hypothetical protein